MMRSTCIGILLPLCSLLTTCVVAKLGRAELAKENRAQGGSTAQHINTFVSLSSDFLSDVRSCTNKIVLNLIVSTSVICKVLSGDVK